MHPTKMSFAAHNHVPPLSPRIPPFPRRNSFQFLIAYMTFVIAWMRDGGAGTGALIALAQRDVVYESGKDTRK